MTRLLLERSEGRVIATCRDPHGTKSEELRKLEGANSGGRLSIVAMDLMSQDSICSAANACSQVGSGRLDLLFNVVGILGDGKSDPGPERTLFSIDRDWMMHSYATNTVGAVMVSQALAPLMKTRGDSLRPGPSIIANVSARVGSISDNRLGGWWSYRMSKAALNQATKCMGLELKRQGTLAFAYHPGTTDTNLSKPFQANVRKDKLFTPEFTAGRLLDLCDAITAEQTGNLFDYSGALIEP